MDYTLSEVYEYILELTDKKGSDFFQLPHVLNVFATSTYDFIGEHIPVIENTQRVTEDLQPLMNTIKKSVLDDPDDPYAVLVAEPKDCYYLARCNPIYKGNVSSRRPNLVRHGNTDALKADPHNKPTREYPLITQYVDFIKIESGFEEKALSVLMIYLKHPEFALLTEPTKRIVNLPNDVIQDIIQKTRFELESSKADERSNISYQKKQSYRDLNK